MGEEKSLVSIIVRTKDRPELLERALRSVAAQTYRPVEVVLVNDGGAEPDLKQLGKILNDISMHCRVFLENRGRAAAANAGLKLAKGAFIGFLDDDDEYYPDHLSILVEALRRTEYKIAYTDAEMVFREYDFLAGNVQEKGKNSFGSKDYSYEALLLENYIPLINLLFAREVFDAVGSFDETFDLYEDWDLLIRCGTLFPFLHIPKHTTGYVQWSPTMQIAQSPDYWGLAEVSYDAVVGKHWGKLNPKRVRGFRDMIHDMKRTMNELRIRCGELEQEVRVLGLQLKDRDDYATNLKTNMEGMRKDMKRIESELRDCSNLLESQNRFIGEIESARGWQLLNRYYRVRDRLRGMLRG